MVNSLELAWSKAEGNEAGSPPGQAELQMVHRSGDVPRRGDTERECAQMVQLPRNLAQGE